MSLLDQILSARKGAIVSDFGKQFDLTDEQVKVIFAQLIPLYGDAIIRTMLTPPGLASVLSQLGSEQHYKDQEAPDLFANSRILSNGTGLLSLMLRNEATIQVVAACAAEAANADSYVARQMMPYVATLYMSALARRAKEPLERLAQRINPDTPRGSGARMLAELVLSASSTEKNKKISPINRDKLTIKDILMTLARLEKEEGYEEMIDEEYPDHSEPVK